LRRMLLVAKRDYVATVRTKAFIIGLVVAPLLFGSGFIGIALLKAKPDIKDRHIAIVDHTGLAAEAVIQAAAERSVKDSTDEKTGKQVSARYVFEAVAPSDGDPAVQRLALSNRVRRGELYAFVEIAADAFQPPVDVPPSAKASKKSLVSVYTNATQLDEAQREINGALNDGLRSVRLAKLGVDRSHVRELLDSVTVDRLGLVSRDEKTGAIQEGHKRDEWESFGVPFAFMMLLGMIVLVGSTPMMAAVTEDKTQRVVEMLLGLATPFELMMGKVLAAVGISLTSSALYVAGGTLALSSMGLAGMVPFGLIPWFYVYLIASMTMLCAMAAALGASCSTPQDAQSLVFLLIFPIIVPYFVMLPVVQQPNGALATVMSLIPFFTPMIMLLRQAMPGGVPAWQPWVGLAGVAACTLVLVWAAARIFRVGILMQGKAPKVGELIRWAVRG
jgi:ABC-2 type transport system permease protein